MKSWRVHQILSRWPRFFGLTEKEQSKLVELVQSLIAEATQETRKTEAGLTEAEHRLVAGTLFMFAAHLTTLPKHRAVQFSEVHNPNPAVDHIEEFAKAYGISIDAPDMSRFVKKASVNSIVTHQ